MNFNVVDLPHPDQYSKPIFFFSGRRRHTSFDCDWSSDVCSSDLAMAEDGRNPTYQASLRAAHFEAKRVQELAQRSEERRVGKECRSRWSTHQYKKTSPGRCGKASPA